METHFVLTILLFTISCTTATFEDEMASLEKDIMDDHTQVKVKKSIKDLSTDELIEELEREFHTPKADSSEKKYRKRFDEIINKKAKLDELANLDVKSLLSDKKEDYPYQDIVMALADSLTEKKKDIDDGQCKDRRSDCTKLSRYCQSHKDKLKVICPKTCEYCVDCKQRVSVGTCGVLKRRGLCNAGDPRVRNRMIKLCPLTCNYCKLPSPPKCSDTTHGCCWDKSTTKVDTLGTNCPPCGNLYKFVCKTFKPDCVSFLKPGEFMRQNCPKACGLCEGKCADDREKQALCPFWKSDLQWCEKKADVMKVFCPKTCGLC